MGVCATANSENEGDSVDMGVCVTSIVTNSEKDLESEQVVNKTIIKGVIIPNDCWGIILSFNSDEVVVKSILSVSRNLKHYIELEFPQCCRFVRFHFWKKPPKRKLRYVNRLVIGESRRYYNYSGQKRRKIIFKNSTISCFPNVKKLVFRDMPRIDVKIFDFLNDSLRILYIDGCKKLTKLNFSKFRNLITLKIDNSHLYNTEGFEYESSDFFIHLRRLEKLVVTEMRFKSFDMNDFRNLTNLRIMKLKFVYQFNDLKILKFTPNLEILELEECGKIHSCEGFKYLSKDKLEVVYIKKCGYFISEEDIFEVMDKNFNNNNNGSISRVLDEWKPRYIKVHAHAPRFYGSDHTDSVGYSSCSMGSIYSGDTQGDSDWSISD